MSEKQRVSHSHRLKKKTGHTARKNECDLLPLKDRAYIAADWESDCPDVLARWGFLGEIILDLAQFFAQSINLFLSFSNPDYEPHFQILVLEDENGRPL